MKHKGKKGKKVVTDLASFVKPEAPKTSEKDINFKIPLSKAASASVQQQETNKCEDDITKFNVSTLEFSVPYIYYALDNKLIDTYYATRLDIFTEDEKELLQPEEFVHFLRLVNKDLDYILGLRFTHFWGLISKTPDILRFLDDFLANVRKHNDIYKMQFLKQFEASLPEQ